MIGDLAKRSVIEDGVNVRFNPRLYISFKGKDPKTVQNPIEDGSFFYTQGIGFVECRIAMSGRERKGTGDFLVNCDMLKRGNTIRVAGFKDFKDKTKDNKAIQFFIKHSTLSAKTFKIAKDNPCTKIPFCVKIEEIYDELKEKYGTGNEILCESGNAKREEYRKIAQKRIRNDKKKVTGNWL